MKIQKAKTGQQSMPFSVLMGTGTSVLLMIASAAIIAVLIINETIDESTIGGLSKTLLFISVFIGISIALLFRREQIMLTAAACAGVIILLQLLICAFSYGGLSGAMLINGLIILGGAGVAMWIKLGRNKKVAQRKKRYR